MMRIFAKLAKEVFNSGKAIGLKTNITDATKYLKAHSKGIGEELGNTLSGKAKKINDKLIKEDLYDKLFAHIDDVARQYPDATVQVAAKNAKKGGYKIAKIDVKNGNKTVYKQALSITDDGTVKTKMSGMGAEMSEFVDKKGVRAIATSDVGTVKATYNSVEKTGQVALSHADEQVAVANYVNTGKNRIGSSAEYEIVDNLVSGKMHYNNHEVSFIGDKGGLKQWGRRYKAEVVKQKESIEPLMISILRPLRDRFNTAIDLFKYNGRTDFERFLSKDELHKSIKELQNETVKLKDLKAKYSSAKDLEYLKQIKNDIKDAEELIKIRC